MSFDEDMIFVMVCVVLFASVMGTFFGMQGCEFELFRP